MNDIKPNYWIFIGYWIFPIACMPEKTKVGSREFRFIALVGALKLMWSIHFTRMWTMRQWSLAVNFIGKCAHATRRSRRRVIVLQKVLAWRLKSPEALWVNRQFSSLNNYFITYCGWAWLSSLTRSIKKGSSSISCDCERVEWKAFIELLKLIRIILETILSPPTWTSTADWNRCNWYTILHNFL